MPGTMLGCCGKFLQWTRTRQLRASIAIFYRVAYLAFDVPSSPNARLDAYLTSYKTYLIRCNSSSSLPPFSHLARVVNASRKMFEDMTSMPPMLVCSQWRPNSPTRPGCARVGVTVLRASLSRIVRHACTILELTVWNDSMEFTAGTVEDVELQEWRGVQVGPG